MVIKLITFLFLATMSLKNAYGVENYYLTHRTGWHWYKDYQIEAEDENKDVSKKKLNHDEIINQKMEAVQIKYEVARKEMVLNPTEKNVLKFIMLQTALLNQADKVSATWKNLLLKYPTLNFELQNPTNSTARKIYLTKQNEKENKAISLLSDNSGLFFFYKSDCPYSREFAPTVKSFAETYNIRVIPISLDGISLPEFPNSRLDSGQAKIFNVKAVPALFAVNPYSKKSFPITYGLISFTDLRQRILEVSGILSEKRDK